MNTVCPSCQTTNRIPEERREEQAKCGRCGHVLFDGGVINANSDNFDRILQDDLPVIVDFWAPWCGPCVNFAPAFEETAEEWADKARFVKLNTEQQQELSARFRIRSIPTIMVFKNGQMIDMLNGALPKAHFANWLGDVLADKK